MSRRVKMLAASAAVLALVGTWLAFDGGRDSGTSSSSSSPPESASASASESAWERVDETIGPDGLYSQQGALWAFVLAFEPLPGVDAPPGRVEHTPRSGTLIIHTLLHYWDQLSQAQRTVVTKYVGFSADTALVTPPEVHGGMGRSRPTRDAAARPAVAPGRVRNIQKLVTDAVTYLQGMTGLALPSPMVALSNLNPPDAQAWTNSFDAPLDATKLAAFQNLQDLPVGNGPTTYCYIALAQNVWSRIPTSAGAAVPFDIRDTTAHELFHCFQDRYVGARSVGDAMDVPAWITEGGAEFAGVSYVGRADRLASRSYPEYLLTPTTPLITRSYNAFPFYFQLLQHGNDPWPKWKALWTSLASTKDNATSFNILAADALAARASLAAGHFRQSSWGSDWEIDAPGIPPSSVRPTAPKLTPVVGRTQTVTAPPFTLALRDIQRPSTKSIVTLTADAPVHVHSGSYDASFTERKFCIGNSCTCPPGEEPSDTDFTDVKAPLHLGVTGMTAGTGLVVTAEKLECRRKRPRTDEPEGGAIGAGGGGGTEDDLSDLPPEIQITTSYGEPHLTTLDGKEYDFQAVGEFVALDAGDGYTVQARQGLVHGFTDVSLNTAVAADVMGDHVQIYSPTPVDASDTIGSLGVIVNGKEQLVADELVRSTISLPNGGTLAPTSSGDLRTGIRVMWPDGSRLYVWPVGNVGVHLMAALGKEQADGATGLLANTSDGMLLARDGSKAVPARTPSNDSDFRSMYRAFGDSWRIRPEESLFTYADGESTADFDRRDVPTKPFVLSDLDASAREQAEQACSAITDPAIREECVFDTAALNDASIPLSYVPAAEKVAAVRATLGGGLHVGSHVGPTPLSNARKVYELTIETEQTVYVRASDDCVPPETGSGQWSLADPSDPSGGQFDYEILCADLGRHTLDPGAYTITWDASEATGAKLSFSVLPVADDLSFSIDMGETVSHDQPSGAGELSTWGERHTFTFDAHAGDEIRIVPEDCESADAPVHYGLFAPGADQETDASWASTCDPYPVTLDHDGEWKIVVSLDATGTGHDLTMLRGTDRVNADYSFHVESVTG